MNKTQHSLKNLCLHYLLLYDIIRWLFFSSNCKKSYDITFTIFKKKIIPFLEKYQYNAKSFRILMQEFSEE